jgi:hypothetical protein
MNEQGKLTEEQRNELLFSQLVFMFQNAAYQQLGKVKNPVTDRVERDLEQARHTIDILGMLEARTRGNLTPGEKQFLDHVLYELRMNYVDEVNKPAAAAEPGPEASSEAGPPEEGAV